MKEYRGFLIFRLTASPSLVVGLVFLALRLGRVPDTEVPRRTPVWPTLPTPHRLGTWAIPSRAGPIILTFAPPDIIVKMAYFIGIRAFLVSPPGIG